MSTGKMTPDDFERLRKLVTKAANEKPYDGMELTETRKLVFGKEIVISDRMDMNKALGGYGKQSFGIQTGEWSLIKAIREGK